MSAPCTPSCGSPVPGLALPLPERHAGAAKNGVVFPNGGAPNYQTGTGLPFFDAPISFSGTVLRHFDAPIPNGGVFFYQKGRFFMKIENFHPLFRREDGQFTSNTTRMNRRGFAPGGG